jgi:hypothetical protein
VFLRRRRQDPGDPRVLTWRVALFFLAAGIWVAGVVSDDARLTGSAILVLFAAILLRLIERRGGEAGDADSEDRHV